MRGIKKILCILLCFVVVVSMTGCPNPIHMRWVPEKFPGSVWSTEDGTITFWVEEEDVVRFTGEDDLPNDRKQLLTISTNMFGKIKLGEEEYDFFIDSAPYCYGMTFLSQAMPEYSEDYFRTIYEYSLASWGVEYKSKKRFVATVEDSTIFEKGTEFEFFRVDTE